MGSAVFFAIVIPIDSTEENRNGPRYRNRCSLINLSYVNGP